MPLPLTSVDSEAVDVDESPRLWPLFDSQSAGAWPRGLGLPLDTLDEQEGELELKMAQAGG